MKTLNAKICESALLALSAMAMLTSCSKQETPEPTPASVDATVPAEPAAPAQAETIALAGPPQPEQWMGQAQDYQKAGDYDRAAQYLIAVQRQQQLLNAQQAAAYWKQMSSFQSSLAARVAAGDPSAKAAAERLRASTMH